jgi:hypothetical protein
MSVQITFGWPTCLPKRLEPVTPATGPEPIVCTATSITRVASARPPPACMIRIGPFIPRAPIFSRRSTT